MPRNSTKTAKASSGPGGFISQKAPVLLESERAALGAAIRDPEAAELVVSELTQEDFYSGIHQRLFSAIRSLSEEQLTVNPVSVSERSNVQLSDIQEAVNASEGIGGAIGTLLADIRRVAGLRRLHSACVNATSAISVASKLEDITESLERELYKGDSAGNDNLQDGADVLACVVDAFIRRQKEGGGPEISTGLRDLDKALVGLRPGKVGIIAARPSMGKTALASTIRRSVLGQGYGVIEFNLEMDKEELAERELAFQAQLNLTKVLRAKGITDEELGRVLLARGALFPGRWYVDDRTYSIAGIRRKSRIIAGRLARNGIKVGLVIVDYLQLAGENGEGREQSIAAVSRGLKFLAKELGCTVLALSQLNRSCEYREDRRPIMSDLRESGSIEQDADWIGFVYREHVYDNSAPPEDTEFIIRKQRSGPIGTVRLRYNPKLVAFSDVDLPAAPPVTDATNVSS